MRRITLLVGGSVVVFAIFCTGACGGDDETPAAATSGDVSPGTTPSTASAGTRAPVNAPTSGNPQACPLSAQQVSAVLGVAVRDAGACTFFPTGDAARPNAHFNRQSSLAFGESERDEVGYREKVSGLGTEAYVRYDAEGATFLVRSPKSIFEVGVDAAGEQESRRMAEALARLILGSE